MSRLSPALLAAGLLSLSAGAFAQPPASPKSPDAPGGPERHGPPQTRSELKAQLEARFDHMDVNHDGKVDEKDREARHQQRIADRFAQIDTDKNGAISKSEFAAAEEHHEEDGPRFGPPRGPMGGRAMLFDHRGGPEGPMMMRGRLPFAPPPGEGMRRGPMEGGPMMRGPEAKPGAPLTKVEFVNRGLERFDRVDTDHDGKISEAERKAQRSQMRRMRDRDDMPSPPQAAPKPGK